MSTESYILFYIKQFSCLKENTTNMYKIMYLSSQGLAVNAYGFDVRAPTGHRSIR